jgi:thiol-disulfide isomerase/thioredoxin
MLHGVYGLMTLIRFIVRLGLVTVISFIGSIDGRQQPRSKDNSATIHQANAGTAIKQSQKQQTPPKIASDTNPFLEYYPRQGSTIPSVGSSFYFQENKKLVKRSINSSLLKKAILIFYGDWCPHCDSFLKTFTQYFDVIELSGITTIFIAVPTIEKLKNWKAPTLNEFKTAENKISSYEIKLLKNKSFVVAIGDKSVLKTSGVDGLPVIVVVKNEKEMFRAVGEQASQFVNLSNQTTLKQFLEIWGKDKLKTDQTIENDLDKKLTSLNIDDKKDYSNTKYKKKSATKMNRRIIGSKKLRSAYKCKKYSNTVNRKKAKKCTEKLNEFDYSKLKVY